MTAQGTTFINLEDETGLINVVCSKGCWARYRRVARGAPALLVRGRLERSEGVINVVAERLDPLPVAAPAQEVATFARRMLRLLRSQPLKSRDCHKPEEDELRRMCATRVGDRRIGECSVTTGGLRPAHRTPGPPPASPTVVVEGPLYSFDTVVVRGTGCDPNQPSGGPAGWSGRRARSAAPSCGAMGSAHVGRPAQRDASRPPSPSPSCTAGAYGATLLCAPPSLQTNPITTSSASPPASLPRATVVGHQPGPGRWHRPC